MKKIIHIMICTKIHGISGQWSNCQFRHTCFIALHFIVLPDIVFYKLKVCGNPVSINLSAPFFQKHLLISCLCVTFW